MGELLKCFANGRRHFADQVTPRGMFIIVWDRGSASFGGVINAVRIVIGGANMLGITWARLHCVHANSMALDRPAEPTKLPKRL